jgi:transposase
MNMSKPDGRKLSEESLEVLRGQAHRLRQQGRTWAEIASIVGVHLSTVMSWSRRFDLGSAEAGEMASAQRGRRFGEGRRLELTDEVGLRQWMLGRPPSALGLPYALWSRQAVQQAVKVKFGIELPIRTVGEYLRRWGFTPQRPAKRALEQRPAQLEQWLEVDYPALVKRAKAEQGQLHWADETAVRQDTAWVRGYAPAGCTPVLEHAVKRPRPGISLISAVSNQGQLRFALYDAAVNAERFIDFMTALVHDTAPAKVFLIVDRLPAHRAAKVHDWLSDKAERIELCYLPPYAPQLNPDEWLNRDLKTELRTRPATAERDALKRMACDFMHTLASLPQRVMGYFRHEHVAYASAEASYCV